MTLSPYSFLHYTKFFDHPPARSGGPQRWNKLRIGFVGIGSMGTPMSMRLINAGRELTVYDIREEAMEPMATM